MATLNKKAKLKKGVTLKKNNPYVPADVNSRRVGYKKRKRLA